MSRRDGQAVLALRYDLLAPLPERCREVLVDLGLDASGLAFPGERPVKWRRKKVF